MTLLKSGHSTIYIWKHLGLSFLAVIESWPLRELPLYMSEFAYADDLTLLYPIFSGTKEMLSLCEQYAHDNQIILCSMLSKSYLIYCKK